jgi:hypothetical protein
MTKDKYKAAVSRKSTLEKELVDIKSDMQAKIKMLLNKTENDDKLVNLLKAEIKRLE